MYVNEYDSSTPEVSQTKAQDKHIRIAGALDSIDMLVTRLASLNARINGEVVEDSSPHPPDTRPSLHLVLDSTADEIHGKCERARAILDEIERALF